MLSNPAQEPGHVPRLFEQPQAAGPAEGLGWSQPLTSALAPERQGIPLDESEFWARLEYRICAELAGFAASPLRFCWCDGLIPEEYTLSGQQSIRGVAWIGQGHKQEKWEFTIVTGQDVRARDGIDWSALLPADHLTGWLTPDLGKKTLQIDPASGYDA